MVARITAAHAWAPVADVGLFANHTLSLGSVFSKEKGGARKLIVPKNK